MQTSCTVLIHFSTKFEPPFYTDYKNESICSPSTLQMCFSSSLPGRHRSLSPNCASISKLTKSVVLTEETKRHAFFHIQSIKEEPLASINHDKQNWTVKTSWWQNILYREIGLRYTFTIPTIQNASKNLCEKSYYPSYHGYGMFPSVFHYAANRQGLYAIIMTMLNWKVAAWINGK